MANISLVHIPYKGVFLTDVMSGMIPVAFEPLTTSVPLVRAGKLRALAVSSPKRSPVLPDVPAISETIAGFDGNFWHGIFASAGTPPDVVAKVNAEVAKIMRLPDVQKRFVDLGVEPVGGTQQEFAALLKKDFEIWGEVIRKNNITLSSA